MPGAMYEVECPCGCGHRFSFELKDTVKLKRTKTKSKTEAHRLLEATRKPYIEMAREIGYRLCREHGEVDTRMVRVEMVALGVLPHPDPNWGETWFGTVFRGDRRFQRSGRKRPEQEEPKDKSHHGHNNDIWVLR